MDSSAAGIFAAMIGLVMLLTLAGDLSGERATTRSWRVGADGEVRTGKALEALPNGFVVLHDLRMPASRANIDHLVIGRTGVFTVETKTYTSPVKIRWGRATRAGRSVEPVIDQARAQAHAVSRVLGLAVTPLVCVQGAGTDIGLLSSPTVEGVRFTSSRSLVKAIVEAPGRLSDDEVRQHAATAEGSLY